MTITLSQMRQVTVENLQQRLGDDANASAGDRHVAKAVLVAAHHLGQVLLACREGFESEGVAGLDEGELP